MVFGPFSFHGFCFGSRSVCSPLTIFFLPGFQIAGTRRRWGTSAPEIRGNVTTSQAPKVDLFLPKATFGVQIPKEKSRDPRVHEAITQIEHPHTAVLPRSAPSHGSVPDGRVAALQPAAESTLSS